jgi:transcriptional regulator GlxA family with amidase domain
MKGTNKMQRIFSLENRLNVGILIFEEVEVLDFCGPFEVFSVAGRRQAIRAGRDAKEETATNVYTIAKSSQIVRTSGNLMVQPHFSFENCPRLDVLVLPGGGGIRRIIDDTVTMDWLARTTAQTALNASVCTGAFLLAQLGLLNKRKATTHKLGLERLAEEFPAIQLQRGVRWVDDGDIVTSGGISAGIDMSLHLIERLFDRELAEATVQHMEYFWNEASQKEALEQLALQNA